MIIHSRQATALAVAVLVSMLSACGSDDDNPGENTPPSTPPATTAPTAPPPPSPNLPGQASCTRIGLGTFNENCGRNAPSFLSEVDRALEELLRERPAIFEPNVNGWRVLSPGQLYVGVIEKLDQRGICSDFDGEELQVKSSNSFNDQYHLITSGFILRRGESSYRATCSPASFPTPAPPLHASPPGCNLAPSRSLTCTRELPPKYLADVDAAIDKVAREHPEVFNFNIVQPGTNWFKIVDPDRYFVFMVQAMTSFGYCSIYDGEELAMKKENGFNEQYDIFAGDGFIRRGEGSYRSTCYPATF